MDKVVKHKTMYRDMINILKESGLADSLNSEIIKVHQWVEDVILSPYLKKGRFYLASWGEGEPFRYVFYVNPVDWFQDDEVGLGYISLEGVKKMLEDPSFDFESDGAKGWNSTYSDIMAIEDYQGTDALKELSESLAGDGDFFRNDGYVFYELPDFRPQFGVFNWWW